MNDLGQLERELAHGDVAAVLMEPPLTDIGIVLPEPGYLAGVRQIQSFPYFGIHPHRFLRDVGCLPGAGRVLGRPWKDYRVRRPA